MPPPKMRLGVLPPFAIFPRLYEDFLRDMKKANLIFSLLTDNALRAGCAKTYHVARPFNTLIN